MLPVPLRLTVDPTGTCGVTQECVLVLSVGGVPQVELPVGLIGTPPPLVAHPRSSPKQGGVGFPDPSVQAPVGRVVRSRSGAGGLSSTDAIVSCRL